jgi:hypothetical protein
MNADNSLDRPDRYWKNLSGLARNLFICGEVLEFGSISVTSGRIGFGMNSAAGLPLEEAVYGRSFDP